MEKKQLESLLMHFMKKHLGAGESTVIDKRLNDSSRHDMIDDLQNLVSQLKDILSVLTNNKETDESCDRIHQNGGSYRDDLETEPDPSQQIDPNLVQVRASKKEMDRRIAAFLDKKRLEVNDGNRREFCCDTSGYDSCARVHSVFVKRPDCKGHVKVSKVFNTYGPQTRIMSSNVSQLPETRIKNESEQTIQDGMEERVKNIADHLNMKLEYRRDLAEKIRCLEERILYLESLSPEYFSKSNQPEIYDNNHRQTERPSSKQQKVNISEIDERIHVLKQSLKRKASAMIQSNLI